MIGTELGHCRILQKLGEGGPPSLAPFHRGELRRGLAEAEWSMRS
jgi:hypothetical protein